jgi:hypothetical protein
MYVTSILQFCLDEDDDVPLVTDVSIVIPTEKANPIPTRFNLPHSPLTSSFLLFGIPQKKKVAKLICEQLRKSKNRTFRWSRRCQIRYIRNNKTTKTFGDGNIVNIEDETSTSTSAATKLL